jgi:DNA-binding transcriptional ArsR family regulator
MSSVELLSSLSSPFRLELVSLLSQEGGLCVNEIAEKSGTSQANASRQLIILRNAGAIKVERQQNKRIYQVDERVANLVNAAREIAGS